MSTLIHQRRCPYIISLKAVYQIFLKPYLAISPQQSILHNSLDTRLNRRPLKFGRLMLSEFYLLIHKMCVQKAQISTAHSYTDSERDRSNINSGKSCRATMILKWAVPIPALSSIKGPCFSWYLQINTSLDPTDSEFDLSHRNSTKLPIVVRIIVHKDYEPVENNKYPHDID